MIVDAFIAPFLTALEWLVSLLPDYELPDLPGLGAFFEWVARVDSLVPIAAPLRVFVTLLLLLTPFLLVRLLLWVRHIVLP